MDNCLRKTISQEKVIGKLRNFIYKTSSQQVLPHSSKQQEAVQLRTVDPKFKNSKFRGHFNQFLP